MQTMDWDDLRVFDAVSTAGSLAGAARRLGVNHSTVLRRIGALERQLAVRLFDRRPAGYALTAAGIELRDRVRVIAEQIDGAHRTIAGRDLELSGAIRVTSTDTLVPTLLTPHFVAFQREHPRIELDVVISNAMFSLNRREADVAIRPGRHPPENLIGRQVGDLPSTIYGAGSYLKRRRRLAKDWAAHDWVGFGDGLDHLPQAQWMARHVPSERIVYRVNSLFSMVEAVRSGAGLGILLCLLAERSAQFVPLVPPPDGLGTELWVLTHPDLRNTARISAFADFMCKRLANEPGVRPPTRRPPTASRSRPR
jgi:DNA-binding transcriptional LysR family regulator